MKSTSLFNNCRVDDDEDGETQEDDISRSRSMPMLPPRVMVESPSDPSPVTSRPRSRHSVMRPSSLRYRDIATDKQLEDVHRVSHDGLMDPWMLSLQHVRMTWSMREMQSSVSGLGRGRSHLAVDQFHHHPGASSLTRSVSCRSPPLVTRHQNQR